MMANMDMTSMLMTKIFPIDLMEDSNPVTTTYTHIGTLCTMYCEVI